MKKIYIITLLAAQLLFSSNLLAQSSRRGLPYLNDDMLEEFKESTKVILKDLGDHITVISSKDQPYEVKVKHTQETYKLFTDEGFGYHVEISFRGKKDQIPNRSYFNNLARLPYAKVEVIFTDILYLSNFYKSAQDRYTATATIIQKFTGYDTEGKIVYDSRDKKNIEITLSTKEDAWGDKIWKVLLGDISVEQTVEN